jgi:outer membrane protein assembly factor BamD
MYAVKKRIAGMSKYFRSRLFMILRPVAFAAVLVLAGCHSSEVTKVVTAEDRFAEGKKKFDDGDYLEAISDFEVIKLQFPGSGVADKAQFYLAESYFNREQYLLAAQEYQSLRRNVSASPLVPESMYKTALCYYNLAPKSSLDQDYTLKAIDEFQNFIEYNSKNELVAKAEERIAELNLRLAQKLYDAAELYMSLSYYRSATIYYEAVVEKYHDTPLAEPALIGHARSLMARKKYAEAAVDVDKFLDRYPSSSRKNEVESLRAEIDNLRKGKNADGTAADRHGS